MSWIQRLYETYENCRSVVGKIEAESQVPLLPICHTTQMAHVEIALDHLGNMKRSRRVLRQEARTISPCTEKSAGRTNNEAPHALNDKLQYVAADYGKFGGKKEPRFTAFEEQLEKWCSSPFAHEKAIAVLRYVKGGAVVSDLIRQGLLVTSPDGLLTNEWVGDAGKMTVPQSEAVVRWVVEAPGDPCSRTWEDQSLWESWINYYRTIESRGALCYVSGIKSPCADQHPAKIRNDGDKAKIISSNDDTGFTFLGRFLSVDEACGVGFEVTQKAHAALRWLISRQGYRHGDQAVVAWATSGNEIPNPLADPVDILGDEQLESDQPANGHVAQDLALRLRKRLAGYSAVLSKTEGAVVLSLQSSTPGRLAITYFRELTASELLERIDRWHESCAWLHLYRTVETEKGKRVVPFVGAPAPRDIAEAAYGAKADDKLKAATVERLLPCIIDGAAIPRDLVDSAVRRASNRIALDNWEWEKALSIGCSLFRKFKEQEGYSMALDGTRNSRDYLYGRLLALADSLEEWALDETAERRQTNAARLMQRFAERPNSTWRTIELALAPYKARLGAKAWKRCALLDEVMNMFVTEDFVSDKKLSGEFLLGYHCQRAALRAPAEAGVGERQSVTELVG